MKRLSSFSSHPLYLIQKAAMDWPPLLAGSILILSTVQSDSAKLELLTKDDKVLFQIRTCRLPWCNPRSGGRHQGMLLLPFACMFTFLRILSGMKVSFPPKVEFSFKTSALD